MHSRVQRAPRLDPPLRRRDRHDPRLRKLGQDSPRQVFARHIRQQQIERDHIRPIAADIVHGLFTARSRGDHGHVFLPIDQRRETFLHQLMTIHREDRDAPGNDPQRRMLYDCRYRRTRHKMPSCLKLRRTGPPEHHEKEGFCDNTTVHCGANPIEVQGVSPRTRGLRDTTGGVSARLVGQLMENSPMSGFHLRSQCAYSDHETGNSKIGESEVQRPAATRLVLKSQRARSEDDALQLSITPLSEPARILRQMPAQAISPALLGLLELMSSPILLFDNRPAGELIEMPRKAGA